MGFNIGPGEESPGIPAPKGRVPTFAGLYGFNPVWGGRGYDTENGVSIHGTSGADEDVNRYRSMGEAAANRDAYKIDYSEANEDMNRAVMDRARAAQARGEQTNALGMMRSAAEGNQPSRAELLGRSMIGQSLRSQLAGAASARGGAEAQMAARRQVQQGAAGFQQQGMNQLAALRADEMERARAAYMQGGTAIRGQDYTGAAQATDMARVEAANAQAQAAIEMQQRNLNQQGQQFYESKGFDTKTAQLNADLAGAALEQGKDQFKTTMEFKRDEAVMDMAGAGIGAGATFGAALARAEGGPVQAGRPYIVGELGPELVVPSKSGMVVPADQTREVLALYEPPGKQLHQGDDGRAFYVDSVSDDDDGRPRLESRKPASMSMGELAAKKIPPPKAAASSRPLTPDELRLAAAALERKMAVEHEARMAQGPAVSVPSDKAPSFMPMRYVAPMNGDWTLDPSGEAMSPMQPRAWAPTDRPNYSQKLAGYRPPAALMGGSEDPYTRPPTMGQAVALMGGREDPYR